MSSSGITRKIDELGRIVVPKEMRSNLGIRDGEPLEISLDNNSIIIKKYSDMNNIANLSNSLVNIFKDVINVDFIITDREKIISSTVSINDRKLNKRLINLIDNRESYISNNIENIFELNKYVIILPIISNSICNGLVIVLSNDYNKGYIVYGKLIQKILNHKLDIN